MPSSDIPDLVGKVIAVKYGNRENRDYEYLEVCGLELHAGREFLVGKTISTQHSDSGGLRFCVAWDMVASYYEFDSVEECHQAIASWYPEKKRWSRLWS